MLLDRSLNLQRNHKFDLRDRAERTNKKQIFIGRVLSLLLKTETTHETLVDYETAKIICVIGEISEVLLLLFQMHC